MKAQRYESGFTLLEVLISSTILFMVITTMMSVYRGALITSQKSESALEGMAYIDEIRFSIKENLFKNVPGEKFIITGEYDGFTYEASITSVAKARSYHPDNKNFDLKVSADISVSTEVYLWKVSLDIIKDDIARNFTYWEITWEI